jgi:D-alanyl-D-alanine endopeptidase (penicillin-binding protein 7)
MGWFYVDFPIDTGWRDFPQLRFQLPGKSPQFIQPVLLFNHGSGELIHAILKEGQSALKIHYLLFHVTLDSQSRFHSFTMRSPVNDDNLVIMIRLLILTLLLAVNTTAIGGKTKPDPAKLWLRSHAAVIVDQQTGEVLYQKNADEILPIASITKLMTAMVILDASLDMEAVITITKDDKDSLRHSRSRLPVGSRLNRFDLLKMALMASENRAAAALARTFPGGSKAFIQAMNLKSRQLNMQNTTFKDSTGLITNNQSTAHDLLLLMKAAWEYPLIKALSGSGTSEVTLLSSKRELKFNNTNRLLRREHWTIGMSKTGYIKESGRCLVMQTTIADRDLFVVLLNAQGKLSSYGDSGRIRKWLERFESKISV